MDDPLKGTPDLSTPSPKRRKLVAVQPTPRASDYLAAFGAQRTPTSVTKMSKQNDGARALRGTKPAFSYAESDGSDPATPESSPNTSDYGESKGSGKTGKASIDVIDLASDSEEEISEEEEDELDTIQVAPSRTASLSTRELPKRGAKKAVSYASPKKPKKKKKSAGRKKAARLTSDLFGKVKATRADHETARSKIRSDIAEYTKPKRNAFLYQHKQYFLPLLPETSYIDKLQRAIDMSCEEGPEIVKYEPIVTQPEGIELPTMKPYQLEGLSFLMYMHRNGMSSILIDEMGLGKTLQTLSLFQYLKEHDPKNGENQPFLVVCPLSVLSSWMNEAKKWTPGLKAFRFHGPKSERDRLKDECRHNNTDIDLIVTTYETYTAEHNWFKRAFVWRYCVLDEGHKIKNEKSHVANALQGLQAEYRLLLTGTPLQNNLNELWALFHWLFPELFSLDTADKFKQAFDLTKGRASTEFMDDARALLELVMLRRMKSSPGVNLGLPPKEEVLLYVPLTPMQRFWYTRILTKSDRAMLSDLFEGAKDKDAESRQIEAATDNAQQSLLELAADDLAGNGDSSNDVWAESKKILEEAVQQEQLSTENNSSEWRKLMNLVMQLRKICAHPYLMPGAAPDPYYLGDHVKAASGKFIVLNALLQEIVVKQRKKILIFSGFTRTLDLCEDLLHLNGANAIGDATFRYLRLDGSTARARRNLGIRMFNDKKSDFQVMLLTTRAAGLGINLASASDVVFMDEDWNPQVTLQAEARAHRIGQQQKVTIYKLCTQGTVEEQMMGRIRKKLYLAAKITESMRSDVHTSGSKKRKRTSTAVDDDGPQLDATSLKSLIRRGAQTLSHPEIDVTEMMNWTWGQILEKCKDRPAEAQVAENPSTDQVDEQSWLNTMEKVECAVFEGKKHQRELEAKTKSTAELLRGDRRIGKNTTVLVEGFMINKESLNCADWEAVPTMAGKDPRLAEPVRAKKQAIENESICHVCFDGGDVYCCSGCPRSYHLKCLDKPTQLRAKSKMQFYCPQHECVDCQAKTADAGGMIYRCRWCERGYCEDCLDWEMVNLLGETLPEYEMLGFGGNNNAWYIECPGCVEHWKIDPNAVEWVAKERKRIGKAHGRWQAEQQPEVLDDSSLTSVGDADVMDENDDDPTPDPVSEVWTPLDTDGRHTTDISGKKMRRLLKT